MEDLREPDSTTTIPKVLRSSTQQAVLISESHHFCQPLTTTQRARREQRAGARLVDKDGTKKYSIPKRASILYLPASRTALGTTQHLNQYESRTVEEWNSLDQAHVKMR